MHCDGKEDEAACTGATPEDTSKQCVWDNDKKACAEVAKPTQGTPKNSNKGTTTTSKESKSSNSASMIKFSLFLLISMLFI